MLSHHIVDVLTFTEGGHNIVPLSYENLNLNLKNNKNDFSEYLELRLLQHRSVVNLLVPS
jgi:hypothetical protein